MGTALDVAKVMAKPAEKLIDAVSAGIGKLYEPRHKRKMADATAYEISVIGDAMRNAADLPVVYNQEGVAINSEDFGRLMQRAGTRLVLQETIKQHNIESIIDNAYEILEKEDTCSSEPVEQGWINRFFDSVADVSNEDLQQMWGKVLAGEIKKPKSFSLRTLNVMRNLSQEDAMIFQKIMPLVVRSEGNVFVSSDKNVLNKHDIYFADIIHLDECGLLSSDSMVSLQPEISKSITKCLYNNKHIAIITGTSEEPYRIRFGVYSLTTAGCELFRILNNEANEEILSELSEHIAKSNNKKTSIDMYKVNCITDKRISHENEAFKHYGEDLSVYKETP